MSTILPNLSCDWFDVSTTKYVIYAIEHYILIGLYTFLLGLAVFNIWTILIKQRRYKTWPLTFFYVFAFLAIFFRLIWLFIEYIESFVVDDISDCYLSSKLSVGLIQSWMILEIALRVRQTYKPCHSANFEKWLKYCQFMVITFSIGLFVGPVIYDLFNIEEFSYETHNDFTYSTTAYSYLGMFFLMAFVNIGLFCVMLRRKKAN